MRAGRAFRPRYPYGDDYRNAFTSFELPAELHAALVRTAKRWGLTRNDLLIAMLLTALAPEVPERVHARRRREIAIASVINIRHGDRARPRGGVRPVPEFVPRVASGAGGHRRSRRSPGTSTSRRGA